MGSIWLWQGEQLGSFRCCSRRSRSETVDPSFDSSRTGTSGGGGGGAEPRRFSSTHLPRTGGDVRVGYEETVKTAPCVNKPLRFSPSRFTRRNSSPVTPLIP